TGMEHKSAKDSGVCIVSKHDGIIERSSANEIWVRRVENVDGQEVKGDLIKHKLHKFMRSNQGTCINQRPIVKRGDVIKKGDILADGPSTEMGELALGRNVVVAFMTWEGYNYEDAILLSEKLVKED
ncbi:DNA-directed RNA polymerase subunit beta, partial [Clostridium perfringens]